MQGLSFRFDDLEPGEYTLALTDSEGCSMEHSYNIIEPSKAVVEILPSDTTIRLGDSLYLPIVHNVANPNITWNPMIEVDQESLEAPLVKPLQDLSYQVRVVNEFGCIATDVISIRVIKDRSIFIPNAFSPNGDGINEVFRIRSINPGIVQIDEFRIFDQFGQLLFEQLAVPPNDPRYGWDGTKQGTSAVQPGVYTYYALISYLDQEVVLFEGKVLLIR